MEKVKSHGAGGCWLGKKTFQGRLKVLEGTAASKCHSCSQLDERTGQGLSYGIVLCPSPRCHVGDNDKTHPTNLKKGGLEVILQLQRTGHQHCLHEEKEMETATIRVGRESIQNLYVNFTEVSFCSLRAY